MQIRSENGNIVLKHTLTTAGGESVDEVFVMTPAEAKYLLADGMKELQQAFNNVRTATHDQRRQRISQLEKELFDLKAL